MIYTCMGYILPTRGFHLCMLHWLDFKFFIKQDRKNFFASQGPGQGSKHWACLAAVSGRKLLVVNSFTVISEFYASKFYSVWLVM